MKRARFVLLAVGLICLGAGCASSGKTALLTQRDPIALVSVVSNWDINWKGEESITPTKAGPFARRILRKDSDMTVVSDADELIETAETLIRSIMPGTGVINFAEKEKLFLSGAYREALLNKRHIKWERVQPEGYRFVDYRDKNFPPALAAETGIQRSMFVEFTFTKLLYSGMGKNGHIGADVDMKVIILNAQGKTLYNKLFSTGSKSSIKVSSGVYSQSGLINLFEDAISDACYDFLDRLGD